MIIRGGIASGALRPASKRNKLRAVQPRPAGGGISVLRVHRSLGAPWSGRLHAGPLVLRCALGKCGIRNAKREGDGATPAGAYRLVGLLQRTDRLPRIGSVLPGRPIDSRDGWCDDPAASAYNRPVVLPFAAGHERLYREDHVYDLLVVLDHNQRPRVRGHGSAIFFHLARADSSGTEGCVAISREDMRRLLPRLAARVRMVIG